jgi:hypothetical protein
MCPSALTSTLRGLLAPALAALLLAAAPAFAQFKEPAKPAATKPTAQPSAAATDALYRKDASKHLYASFPAHVFKGKLPPLLVGVAIVNTSIDEQGNVTAVDIVRPPAMKEISPWLEGMIRAAAPYPAPSKLGTPVTWREIFLVEDKARFQTDALTEGQRAK